MNLNPFKQKFERYSARQTHRAYLSTLSLFFADFLYGFLVFAYFQLRKNR